MSAKTRPKGSTNPLARIPVVDVGPRFAVETLMAEEARARALLAGGAGHTPDLLVHIADRVSRGFLARGRNPYLAEIDEVARHLGRPGAHFLNVHYEWGCTTGVKTGAGESTARLARVLDWRMPGLGRQAIAARIASPRGTWVSLTWPGFAGVLQGMAPGRFSAAINQAPMDVPVGIYAADWAVNRTRILRSSALPPAHLLRQVFEEAPDYASARRRLAETPLCAPAIFTLAGLEAGEGVIIERRESEARLHDGGLCAANHWHAQDWRGRERGKESEERSTMLRGISGGVALDLGWLRAPMLNERTRLALVADASLGRLVAQGYESGSPATTVLELAV